MIAYRDPVPADAAPLDAMAQESWLKTFGHLYNPADLAAYFGKAYGPTGALIRDLADPVHRFRLATDDGAIVGYAKISPVWLPDIDPASGVQLSQLYTAYSHHGTGVGRALLDWTIAEARAAGVPHLYLTVWEDNHRAKRFYEREGFVHIGDYAFPIGEQIDRDLIMRLDL